MNDTYLNKSAVLQKLHTIHKTEIVIIETVVINNFLEMLHYRPKHYIVVTYINV